MTHDLRQIIEEGSFTAARAVIEPDARRLDEVLEAVWTQLSVAAELGAPVPGTNLYAIRTADYPEAPAVSVIYRYDDEHVYLVGLELY
jgi:hypothetical protein